jgi:quercetin dioxygenase-like cupin family protein
MKPKAFVVKPGSYPAPLKIVGEEITVLASGEATNGYEIFFQKGPEGSGPPPHFHDWDESFFVTRGRIEFGIAEGSFVAEAGTLVHLPGGTTHWFRFGAGGAEMISMTSRRAASQMFTDMHHELSSQDPDLEKLKEIGARYGLEGAY